MERHLVDSITNLPSIPRRKVVEYATRKFDYDLFFNCKRLAFKLWKSFRNVQGIRQIVVFSKIKYVLKIHIELTGGSDRYVWKQFKHTLNNVLYPLKFKISPTSSGSIIIFESKQAIPERADVNFQLLNLDFVHGQLVCEVRGKNIIRDIYNIVQSSHQSAESKLILVKSTTTQTP
jgi:hypothetical protein